MKGRQYQMLTKIILQNDKSGLYANKWWIITTTYWKLFIVAVIDKSDIFMMGKIHEATFT